MTQLFVSIKGADEFAKVLKSAPEISMPILQNALNATAFNIEAKAKQKAPVREGRLRGSITTMPARVSSREIIASVGTNLKYAPYQEFGTGVYAGNPPITPKRARVLRFKTRGGQIVFARQVKGTKPIHYFRDAISETRDFFESITERALELINRKLATL